MKRMLPAFLAFAFIFSAACTKDSVNNSPAFVECGTGTSDNPTGKIYYDFIVRASANCSGNVLTINDCGDASYKAWYSTSSCSGSTIFNGLVSGSGNPLLFSNPATFPNIGATYNIFDNSTTATRDVLSVTFHTGYNASHKPTISYNTSTRTFTISNYGNPTYITVTKFSYTGIIAPGILEFC